MRKPLLILASLLLVAYVVFQGRYFIFGPNISVESPINGSLVKAGVIEVYGKALNITHLTLDDRQIYTDKDGHFREKLIAQRGRNIIEVSAKDRFGREREILVEVFAE